MFAAITPVLLFTAFLLLLLVSLSVPIIKSIYLFRLAALVQESIIESSVSGSVTFGVWGYCTSAINEEVVGISKSEAGSCSKPHLGFTFDSTVTKALGVSSITNALSKATTGALVLHPIACGLTFLALLCSLGLLHPRTAGTRLSSLLTLFTSVFAAFITTVVFLIDVILVGVLHSHVSKDTGGDVSASYGDAVWMTLGAALAIWMACVGACAGVFSCGGFRRKRGDRY